MCEQDLHTLQLQNPSAQHCSFDPFEKNLPQREASKRLSIRTILTLITVIYLLDHFERPVLVYLFDCTCFVFEFDFEKF